MRFCCVEAGLDADFVRFRGQQCTPAARGLGKDRELWRKAPPLRTRNAILDAMELLRDAHPTLTLAQIVAFLYVADEDDEATPLSDLQFRAGLSPVQAWRAAKALEGDDGLVVLTRWKSRNTLAVGLSPAGRELRARLDAILRRAEPIVSRRARADAA